MKIRKPLVEKISDSLKNGADPTITNNSQFVDLAIREKLARMKEDPS